MRRVEVESKAKTDREQIIVLLKEEGATAGGVVQWPAERVLDQTFLMLGWIDLPDLLEPDAEFRRLAAGVEGEFRDQLLGQAAARAFSEQRVFAEQLHAARI